MFRLKREGQNKWRYDVGLELVGKLCLAGRLYIILLKKFPGNGCIKFERNFINKNICLSHLMSGK